MRCNNLNSTWVFKSRIIKSWHVTHDGPWLFLIPSHKVDKVRLRDPTHEPVFGVSKSRFWGGQLSESARTKWRFWGWQPDLRFSCFLEQIAIISTFFTFSWPPQLFQIVSTFCDRVNFFVIVKTFYASEIFLCQVEIIFLCPCEIFFMSKLKLFFMSMWNIFVIHMQIIFDIMTTFWNPSDNFLRSHPSHNYFCSNSCQLVFVCI